MSIVLRVILITRESLPGVPGTPNDENEETPKGDPEQEHKSQKNEDSSIHALSHGRIRLPKTRSACKGPLARCTNS